MCSRLSICLTSEALCSQGPQQTDPAQCCQWCWTPHCGKPRRACPRCWGRRTRGCSPGVPAPLHTGTRCGPPSGRGTWNNFAHLEDNWQLSLLQKTPVFLEVDKGFEKLKEAKCKNAGCFCKWGTIFRNVQLMNLNLTRCDIQRKQMSHSYICGAKSHAGHISRVFEMNHLTCRTRPSWPGPKKVGGWVKSHI